MVRLRLPSVVGILGSLLWGITLYPQTVIAINSTGLTDSVQWDPHSLFILGQRVFILSAEVHPWRSLNPLLWRDIFEKVKDNGFNTISFYVHWALHYPYPGINNDEGDFAKGTYRDLQLFIDEAKRAGLWLIARPGPYINGETTGGGIPGWASNNAGALRTNAADYTAAWTPYIIQVAKIVAKNQVSNGGPIILVQVENEFSQAASHNSYMQAIEDTYRANGVVVPFTHNDQHSGQTGNFSPDTDTTPGNGAVNIYCGDSYPQGSNSWAQVQSIYRSAHVAVAPSNPLCLAEFGGGFLLDWGSKPMGGTGYEKYTDTLDNADYENVFYKENYAQTATILNIYMLFGGTNWGNTAEPTVYSSYDYGGGIDENRLLTAKMPEMRLQGSFLRVSRDILASSYLGNGTDYTTSAVLFTQELRNSETGAGFYFVRHADSTSTSISTSQLNVQTSFGNFTIPASSNMTIQGREHKIVVTDYVFGLSNARILYSTAEIMTWTTIDATDFILLYALAGQSGETTFVFAERPIINFNGATNVRSTYDGQVLSLSYTVSGITYVNIKAGPSSITAIIMEKQIANTWHAPILMKGSTFGNYFSVGSNNTFLIGGPYLIRSASISGSVLNLDGDLNGTTTMEIIAPETVKRLNWNGVNQIIGITTHGSLVANVPGVSMPALPALGPWKVLGSLPEVNATFDDTAFTAANQTTTNYTSLPPLTPGPILYSQQYGFFGGIQIYRGHFNGTGNEIAVTLSVQGGFAFGYSAFVNGIFLGSNQGNSTVSSTSDSWDIPLGAVIPGNDNVLVVVMDHMGLVETSTNNGKEPRGIRGVALIGGNTTFTSWKIQGNFGGNTRNPDAFRGYMNEGALYATRIGAHLPNFDDAIWETKSTLTVGGAGINFFRNKFYLHLPDGDLSDIPVRLSFTPSSVTSNYRVQIYLNGWMVGEYINNIGPQTVFVLPSGILLRRSENILALSLWSLDSSGAFATVELVADGAFTSSHAFSDWVEAPDYEAQKKLRPKPEYYPPM